MKIQTNLWNGCKLFAALVLSALILLTAGTKVYAEDAELEEAMGLIETISGAGQYFPADLEQPMTRGQFILAAEALFGANAGSTAISFTDVAAEDPLYAALGKAVSLGWVSDGDTFRPEDTITLNEAVKICCGIAGYDVRAKLMGGYPTGYTLVATRAGILDSGLGGVADMNGKAALQLIWNTLNTDKMEAVSYGGEENSYAATEGETVLAVNYNIYRVEGIMHANAYTAFGVDGDTGQEARAEINGGSFLNYTESLNDYLGYNVRGYYRKNEDGGKHELVYAFPVENRVLNLRAKDAAYDPARREISYDGETRTQQARLNPGFEYVYNGRADYRSGDAILPADGYLTLIDNDNNGSYDVVSVQECYYLEVGAVNKYYYTITDKWDAAKHLDFSSDNSSYRLLNAEGQELTLLDIEADTMLAVYASRDKLLVRAVVCEDAVGGGLTAIYTGQKKLTVGDAEYEISPEFETRYLSTLSPGKEYEFVLGVYGEVIKATSLEDKWFYAYVKNAAVTGNFTSQLQLKIFTQYGEHQIVACTDKITLNGDKKSGDEVYDVLAPGGAVAAQLIRCKKDAEGKISAIATATVETTFDPEQERSEEELKQYDFGRDSYYFYRNHFYPSFNAAGSVTFQVPASAEKANDDKAYAVGVNFEAVGSRTFSKNVLIPYDIAASGTAGAVVYKSDSTAATMASTTPVILIESVASALDAEGNTRTQIYGWSGGNFVEYFLDEDIVVQKNGAPAQLESGDIIHGTVQGDTLVNLAVDFIGATLQPDSSASAVVNASNARTFQYQIGKVYHMQDGYMHLSGTTLTDGSYDFSMAALRNIQQPTTLVIYDTEEKTIRTADASYIRTYLSHGSKASYMVVWQSYFSSRYGFIYQSE